MARRVVIPWNISEEKKMQNDKKNYVKGPDKHNFLVNFITIMYIV